LTKKINPITIKTFNTLGSEFIGSTLKKIFINSEKAKNNINQKIGSFKNSLSFFLNILLIKIKHNTMKNKLTNKLPSRKQKGASDIINNDMFRLSLIEP